MLGTSDDGPTWPAVAAAEAAADVLLADAKGHGGNDFKIPLARRTLKRALRELTEAKS